MFKISKSGKLTVLYTFSGNGDGANPGGNLVRDAEANLYGTTEVGGIANCGNDSLGCGTIFKLDKHNKLTTLYRFTGGTDGAIPTGVLARDSDGNLYGTAALDGDPHCPPGGFGGGCGTVFKLTP